MAAGGCRQRLGKATLACAVQNLADCAEENSLGFFTSSFQVHVRRVVVHGDGKRSCFAETVLEGYAALEIERLLGNSQPSILQQDRFGASHMPHIWQPEDR